MYVGMRAYWKVNFFQYSWSSTNQRLWTITNNDISSFTHTIQCFTKAIKVRLRLFLYLMRQHTLKMYEWKCSSVHAQKRWVDSFASWPLGKVPQYGLKWRLCVLRRRCRRYREERRFRQTKFEIRLPGSAPRSAATLPGMLRAILKLTVKLKLFLCVSYSVWWSGHVAPHIIDLGCRWEWPASSLVHFNSDENVPGTHRVGNWEDQRSRLGIELWILGSLVTIPVELPGLLSNN